ncbi:MAG: hypothetical protein AAF847_09605 [Bacteroidota bacterium]
MYLAPLNYDRFFKKVFSDERIAQQFLEDFLGIEIEAIELQPLDHKLTNEASLVSFDYRCKIDGKFIIIDMQQWYKHDVVKRFYMYHAANTVLQLEDLPLKSVGRERKTKDYRALLPVITLIWMVDDGLKFDRDYTTYTMLPVEVLNFLQDKPLWEEEHVPSILEKRAEILKLVHNDTKNLSFLQQNQLIFAFQSYIIRNDSNKDKRYARWFEFAEKTRDSGNTKEDFVDFEDDPVFSELIRRLNHKSLNKSDRDYIFYYDEMLGVMEAKVRDSKEEGIEIGEQIGLEKGEQIGLEKGEQIGGIKRDVETTVHLLKNFPNFEPAQIGKMVRLDLDLIKRIQSILQDDTSEELEGLVSSLFESIDGLESKEMKDLVDWLAQLLRAEA